MIQFIKKLNFIQTMNKILFIMLKYHDFSNYIKKNLLLLKIN